MVEQMTEASPKQMRSISSTHKRKYLVFRLSEERYCIPLLAIKEVIAVPKITPIPLLPPYFMGLLNLRGLIVTVVDLRKKRNIELQEIDKMKSSIIISHLNGLTIGFVVDEVVSVVGYSDNELSPENDGKEVISGVAKQENSDELTLVLDLEKAIGEETFNIIRSQDFSEQ